MTVEAILEFASKRIPLEIAEDDKSGCALEKWLLV